VYMYVYLYALMDVQVIRLRIKKDDDPPSPELKPMADNEDFELNEEDEEGAHIHILCIYAWSIYQCMWRYSRMAICVSLFLLVVCGCVDDVIMEDAGFGEDDDEEVPALEKEG
jgi:hypothetical protein